MDCCNYMQYRHHQPYYGSQFYHEPPLPPYQHGEYYGQQMYHDYYGNTPYYHTQQWQGFQADYVYNPKEARIRKAMREAMRDRSIGASPMLPRPSARRVGHGWMAQPPQPHDELIMSPPPGSMRRPPPLDSPGCFPISTGNGNDQFMSPMNGGGGGSGGYAKLDAPRDAEVHPATDYMQPNPLAQLQQQTEMWHNFQDIRPRSINHPYMLQDQLPPHQYHHRPQPPPMEELPPSPMLLDKNHHRQTPAPQCHTPHAISLPMTPPHSNENVPPDGGKVSVEPCLDVFEKQHGVDPMQPLMENNGHQNGEYVIYDGGNVVGHQQQQQPFEKVDEVRMKKPLAPPQSRTNGKKRSSTKPLPDFNEAFGSTERGRFQSPPDPRLAPLDIFFDESPQIKFEDFQI